jgi:hypothetical protein
MAQPQRATALKYGWRSGLEERVAKELTSQGVGFSYEELTGEYEVPPRRARYTPDFVLPNGIIVETKGRWVTADRQKIRLIRSQHPTLDLRMVFSNSKARISKQSQTTYADFCRHLDIPFADKIVPVEWVGEPTCPKRWAAIERFRQAGATKKGRA